MTEDELNEECFSDDCDDSISEEDDIIEPTEDIDQGIDDKAEQLEIEEKAKEAALQA